MSIIDDLIKQTEITGMLETLNVDMLPDADKQTFIFWGNDAKIYFEVISPNEEQIKAVALFGEDAKLLKGLI